MEKQINKMIGAMNKWRWKGLTLIGKINVLRAWGIHTNLSYVD